MYGSPFNQQNPLIAQIRRELRGKLPRSWMDDLLMVLEYQMSYQTLEDMDDDTLLKLKISAEKSPTLAQCLDRIVQQTQAYQPLQYPSNPPYRSPNSSSQPPDFQGGNWGRFLPWNTEER